jgi:nitrite reductase/ring-hydroxylating ferredoxin subunit
MPLVKVASLSILPAGQVMEVNESGEPYAVCNVQGELYALNGVCPHQGGPLGEGALHDTMLVCPWHAWEFDCRTGQNDFDPDVTIEKIPVSVDRGEIYLDLP